MGPLVVELFEKIIEFALLLQAVPARGARGLRFEREVHRFMPAILLRMTGLDAFVPTGRRPGSHFVLLLSEANSLSVFILATYVFQSPVKRI
jgi:hypothetical protein